MNITAGATESVALIGEITVVLEHVFTNSFRFVGQMFVVQSTVDINPLQRVEAFSRLYKDGTVYHSSSYSKVLTNAMTLSVLSVCLAVILIPLVK